MTLYSPGVVAAESSSQIIASFNKAMDGISKTSEEIAQHKSLNTDLKKLDGNSAQAVLSNLDRLFANMVDRFIPPVVASGSDVNRGKDALGAATTHAVRLYSYVKQTANNPDDINLDNNCPNLVRAVDRALLEGQGEANFPYNGPAAKILHSLWDPEKKECFDILRQEKPKNFEKSRTLDDRFTLSEALKLMDMSRGPWFKQLKRSLDAIEASEPEHPASDIHYVVVAKCARMAGSEIIDNLNLWKARQPPAGFDPWKKTIGECMFVNALDRFMKERTNAGHPSCLVKELNTQSLLDIQFIGAGEVRIASFQDFWRDNSKGALNPFISLEKTVIEGEATAHQVEGFLKKSFDGFATKLQKFPLTLSKEDKMTFMPKVTELGASIANLSSNSEQWAVIGGLCNDLRTHDALVNAAPSLQKFVTLAPAIMQQCASVRGPECERAFIDALRGKDKTQEKQAPSDTIGGTTDIKQEAPPSKYKSSPSRFGS